MEVQISNLLIMMKQYHLEGAVICMRNCAKRFPLVGATAMLIDAVSFSYGLVDLLFLSNLYAYITYHERKKYKRRDDR